MSTMVKQQTLTHCMIILVSDS